MKTFAEALVRVMKAHKKRQIDLVDAGVLTSGHANQLWNGKRLPSEAKINDMARAAGLTEEERLELLQVQFNKAQ